MKDIKVPVPKPLPPPSNNKQTQQKPINTESEVDRLMAMFDKV